MNIRSRPVSLALVGLFVGVTACSTTYTQIEPGEVADKDYVRVTLTDGEKMELHEPTLDADSLRGRVKEVARIGGYRWSDNVAVIPLESIAEVGVRETDGGTATAVAVVGGMVLLSLIAIAATSDMPFK